MTTVTNRVAESRAAVMGSMPITHEIPNSAGRRDRWADHLFRVRRPYLGEPDVISSNPSVKNSVARRIFFH
ncbi:hypothetical protein [Streptomyces rhizosphaericus]|uniref:Uncharacterized protein n=1 Tax=Streptomyces rhizosphaericus TaxID=114699 RepID=A0A6G4AGB6_9ACTN|nr:hypothetical protein [Streptomyces rhizosphaericus]NEW72383.1 hypothetical protein [Streptomyces rhizosphaericus]